MSHLLTNEVSILARPLGRIRDVNLPSNFHQSMVWKNGRNEKAKLSEHLRLYSEFESINILLLYSPHICILQRKKVKYLDKSNYFGWLAGRALICYHHLRFFTR